MVAQTTWGLVFMVGAGLLFNTQMVLSSKLSEAGWPDFIMLGIAWAAAAVAAVLCTAVSRAAIPEPAERKFVVLAGFLFAGSMTFMIFAVRVGTPLGDFAALNSCNMIFAAFLGRVFLQEMLHWAHYVAIFCSVLGALLISKPEMLFGKTGAADTAWLGSLFALASGFCDAGLYVCARRSPNASPFFMVISFATCATVVIFATLPLVGTGGLAALADAPWEASAWLAALFVASFFSITFLAGAAQWCPAAASATVDLATRMVSGYLAQVLLFGGTVEALTLCGAGLMFLSVGAMTVVQAPKAGGAEEIAEQPSPPPTDHQDEDSDNESLVSFAASEFSGGISVGGPLRRRRPADPQGPPAARVIGNSADGFTAGSA